MAFLVHEMLLFSFSSYFRILQKYIWKTGGIQNWREEGSAADIYVVRFDGAISKIVFWAHIWHEFFLIVERLNEWQPTQNISEYFILILLNGYTEDKILISLDSKWSK